MSGNSVANRFGRRDHSDIGPGRGGAYQPQQGFVMRVKALAVVVVLMLSAALFVEMRKDNRANAAASNCYSDAQGPSSPTICN
jgi:hypothetical protein